MKEVKNLMNPKIKKGSLITIIVLLVIFVPLAVIGTISHFANKEETTSNDNTNPNQEFYYNNALWFYGPNKELLNTYACTTTNCGYALNNLEDSKYGLEFFDLEPETAIKTIADRYAVLKDAKTEEAFIYDYVNGISYKMAAYMSAKDYGIGLSDNRLIVQNKNGQYGVIKLADAIEVSIPMEYGFLGLKGDLDDNGLLLADHFIASKDGLWQLKSANGAVLTEMINNPIVDFTGTYIITKNSQNQYELKNYENESIIEGVFKKLSFTDRYINVTTMDSQFYIYDPEIHSIISETYDITDNDEIFSTVDTNNNVVISLNNEVVETIKAN